MFFLLYSVAILLGCSVLVSTDVPTRLVYINNGSELLIELRTAGTESASVTIDLGHAQNRVLNLSAGPPLEDLPPQGSLEAGAFVQIIGLSANATTNYARSDLYTMPVIDFNNYEATSALMVSGGRLVMQDIIMTGCCFRYTTVHRTLRLGWYSSTQLNFFSMSLGSSTSPTQRVSQTRVAQLTNMADVAMHTYLHCLSALGGVFVSLKSFWSTWLQAMADPQSVVTRMTPMSLEMLHVSTPLSTGINRTLTADPADLGLAPGVVSMRLCNGSRAVGRMLTEEEFAANTTISPLFSSTTSTDLLHGLVQTMAYTSDQAWPPVLVLYGYHSLTVAISQSLSNTFDIRSIGGDMLPPFIPASPHTIVLGPFGTHALTWGWGMAGNGGSSSGGSGMVGTAPAVLDLGGYTEALVRLQPSSTAGSTQPQLYLHNVVLRGLLRNLLPGQPAGGSASALPLWALAATDRLGSNTNVPAGNTSAQLLQLDNVVVVLPQSDYGALLAAAMRGVQWKAGAVTTAPIFAGISKFVPVPLISKDGAGSAVPTGDLSAYTYAKGLLQELYVTSFEGWGWSGSDIKFVPEQPLTLCPTLPDLGEYAQAAAPGCGQNEAMQEGQSDHERVVRTAVGVGVGVGGGVALAAALTILFIARRRPRGGELRTIGNSQDTSNKLCALLQHTDAATNSHRKSEGGSGRGGGGGTGPAGGEGGSGGGVKLEDGQAVNVERLMRLLNARSPPPRASISRGALGAAAAPADTKNVAGGQVVKEQAMLAPRASKDEGEGEGDRGLRRAGTTAMSTRASKEMRAFVDAGGATSPGHGGDNPTAAELAAALPLDVSQVGVRQGVETVAATLDEEGDADRVTLGAVLGEGSWGKVYLGNWRGLDVAVKTVLFTSAASSMNPNDACVPAARAVTEAAVCLAVNHVNVIATYHYDIKQVAVQHESGQQIEVLHAGAGGVADYKLFLIQELAKATLQEALSRKCLHTPAGRPIEPLALWVLTDVSAGLAHLHSKHIVHGDIKPANVLLKADPSRKWGFVAKLGDFGLSAALGPSATHLSNFQNGTPFYVAPEILQQARVTRTSDIYSLGVLLWAVYSNQKPYVYDAQTDKYNPNTSFPHLPNYVPPAFEQLMFRCLAHNPRLRPSAYEVHQTLATLLEQLGQVYPALPLEAVPTADEAGQPGPASAFSAVPPSSDSMLSPGSVMLPTYAIQPNPPNPIPTNIPAAASAVAAAVGARLAAAAAVRANSAATGAGVSPAPPNLGPDHPAALYATQANSAASVQPGSGVVAPSSDANTRQGAPDPATPMMTGQQASGPFPGTGLSDAATAAARHALLGPNHPAALYLTQASSTDSTLRSLGLASADVNVPGMSMSSFEHIQPNPSRPSSAAVVTSSRPNSAAIAPSWHGGAAYVLTRPGSAVAGAFTLPRPGSATRAGIAAAAMSSIPTSPCSAPVAVVVTPSPNNGPAAVQDS